LNLEEAPKPEAGEGQVLVRVHATTVNPFDCVARAGYVAAYYTYAFPHVLGLDVSGVVEAVGAGVTSFALATMFMRGQIPLPTAPTLNTSPFRSPRSQPNRSLSAITKLPPFPKQV
jgi:NADPH:quinone reductase-like Zn-dependent oxidoreductase